MLVYSVSWGRPVPVSVLSFVLLHAFPFTPTDTTLRAIGKQAHTLHSLVYFSFNCVLGSTTGYAWAPLLAEGTSLDTHPSMVLFKITPVIPTNFLWFAMLLLIGILGLISQVRPSVPSSSVADP